MIRVNELFATIQGEGHWTGTPSTFVRLQGCEVGCPWCDTKHTWKASDRKRVDRDTMLAKTVSAPTWAQLDAGQLAAEVLALGQRHVVITGGEPCEQDIHELTVRLARQGRVQIETSGTQLVNVDPDTWVTLSPKVDMPGQLTVKREALDRADEIKMPVASQRDIDVLETLLEERRRPLPLVYLQPVSQDPAATELCIATCLARGWNLSLQTHKFASVR